MVLIYFTRNFPAIITEVIFLSHLIYNDCPSYLHNCILSTGCTQVVNSESQGIVCIGYYFSSGYTKISHLTIYHNVKRPFLYYHLSKTLHNLSSLRNCMVAKRSCIFIQSFWELIHLFFNNLFSH